MAGARAVLTIGGATAERVLVVDPVRFRPGGKHLLVPRALLPGGSAVNHACRLLATGIDVEPLVPLCRDPVGELLHQAMAAAAARGGARVRGDSLFLEGPGLSTPFTTVTAIGGERTIFTEFSPALCAPFSAKVEQRAARLSRDATAAVLVGHLHCDGANATGGGGALTRRLVTTAKANGIPLVMNPGSTQYGLGFDAFADELGDVACLQLDLHEMRAFLSRGNGTPSLVEILETLRDRCTVVVTLERMGAVGRRHGSPNLVLTWPYEIDPVDTTGAGDAFAAGLVASLVQKPLEDDAALQHAMERGGLFAAHACTTLGGATECPTAEALDAFAARHRRAAATEVTTSERAQRVLQMLDRAFAARA